MSDYWCLDLIKDDDDGNEERKYTFSEWFRICNEIIVNYDACYDACSAKARVLIDDLLKCADECEKIAIEHGKKYGLSEIETKMCLHL